LPGRIKDDYAEKWRRFNALNARRDPEDQYEAGKILGELTADILMTIAGAASGAGAIARIASKAPRLAKLVGLGKRVPAGRPLTVAEAARPPKAAASPSPRPGSAPATAMVRPSAGPSPAVARSTPEPPPKAPPPEPPKAPPPGTSVRRIPVSGPRLQAQQDGALHNRDWARIHLKEGDFEAKRPGKLDLDNLSASDAAARDVLEKQGYSQGKVNEILDSGADFKVRQFKKDELLYAFDSADYIGKDANSPYWMDKLTYENMQKNFKKGDLWDRQGVKEHLALPCCNKADGLVQGQVKEAHLGVESTVGKATEKVTYQATDGTLVPRSHALPGGGKQVTPGIGKVVPLGAR
jgi:hypothetical protein